MEEVCKKDISCPVPCINECLFKEAADAIEELTVVVRAQKAVLEKFPKWNLVTERLPENVCKSYLCLTDTGYHCEARWTNNVYGLCKSDNNWGWSIADVPQYCKVTHWMPLPEPPEEGIDNG